MNDDRTESGSGSQEREGKRRRVTSFNIREPLKERMERYTSRVGISNGQFIEAAIEFYLDHKEDLEARSEHTRLLAKIAETIDAFLSR